MSDKLNKGSMQRLAPFNPKAVSPAEHDALFDWQGDEGGPEHRAALPAMDPNAKMRALHKLTSITPVRRKEDGSREFLLHRGMGPEEAYSHDGYTSWTPHKQTATNFAEEYGGKMVSAWIPEAAIHHVPSQYGMRGEEGKLGSNPRAWEHEVIVAPKHGGSLATPDEVPMSKAEDEISKLIGHPNRLERKMALKLDGVQPAHLAAAFAGDDPELHSHALHHSVLNREALTELYKLPERFDLKMRALQHPSIDDEHMHLLWSQFPCDQAASAIAGHPKANTNLLLELARCGKPVYNHPMMPQDELEGLLQSDGPQHLMLNALQNANVPGGLLHKLARHMDPAIQLAAVQHANLPAETATDILMQGQVGQGDPALRIALLKNPNLMPKHLDIACGDRDPSVRAAVTHARSPHLHPRHIDSVIGRWLGKAESNLLGNPQIETNSQVVADMLGHNHQLRSLFDAAKFLVSGTEVSLEAIRRALWDHDGDIEAAALAAYGIDPTEESRRALRAVRELAEFQKSEEQSSQAQSVEAALPDGNDTAEMVRRAFADKYVFPVKLNGKHAAGSMLARDEKSGHVFLLKPGSGGQTPAAGANEDPSTQSRREAAFWAVADDWGLGDALPRADLLIIDGKEYAVMRLLPWSYGTLDKKKQTDPNAAQSLLLPYLRTGNLHRWAVLDFVLGNPDRHAQNIMVDEHGDVKLIDHGSAMAGDGFDPAHDKNSFTPYYLRAWVPVGFNKLDAEEKLKAMPRASSGTEQSLKRWILALDEVDLQSVLHRYGVNAEPALARLAKLKTLAQEEPADLAINKLWVIT